MTPFAAPSKRRATFLPSSRAIMASRTARRIPDRWMTRVPPHSFTTDISGGAYEDFVATMLRTHAEFSLVWRDQLHFNDKANRVRDQLRALERHVDRTVRWPGTLLMKGAGLATVIRYECNDSAAAILRRPRRLFGWTTPNYPEDLAFYDTDGTCALATISHEGEGWVLSATTLSVITRWVTTEPEEVSDDTRSILRGVIY